MLANVPLEIATVTKGKCGNSKKKKENWIIIIILVVVTIRIRFVWNQS